jgi:hypothetical protein
MVTILAGDPDTPDSNLRKNYLTIHQQINVSACITKLFKNLPNFVHSLVSSSISLDPETLVCILL